MEIMIKEMEAMKVAYYRVISRTPENDCWNHIKEWGEKNKIFSDTCRIFGFNNPSPEDVNIVKDKDGDDVVTHSDISEYGYEFQVTANENTNPENGGRGVGVKTVPGGKFAVLSIGTVCKISDIGKGWATLAKAVEEKKLKPTGRWFEEHIDFTGDMDNFRMDLYAEVE